MGAAAWGGGPRLLYGAVLPLLVGALWRGPAPHPVGHRRAWGIVDG
ncbi:hypothetical protein ABT009_20910 [Streptomyces sp. NPDC002896]